MSTQTELDFEPDPWGSPEAWQMLAAENARLADEGETRLRARTARRVHLPIYGEREIDRLVRRAFADPGYGDFITENHTELAWWLDEHEQISGMSMHDVGVLLRQIAKLLNTDPGDDDDDEGASPRDLDKAFAEERHDLSMNELAHEGLRDRYLLLYAKQRLRREVREREFGHAVDGMRCGGTHEHVLTGLEPPTHGGVYALEGLPGWVKIGKAKNIAARIRDLQVAQPVPLRLLAVLSRDPGDESKLHRQWAHLRGTGEWFRVDEELRAWLATRRAPQGGRA